ncbi:16S rRNA (uracil(1498)-N(3))-methyltransferase [Oceanomicrobium pacificus]|uniref:Ribosomal RNA small subunit methyltransferase E n=1 Tax=Oceanomicrobium pacificus TaxID=2692916 RepID=A0A6B0U7E5_9RHOB|nr:16S rRNA (uracil(1498)-N(3))-methyltransferase [Oceanomicrobium pacificus]MXU66791.1 16S rRNA (uracil(1498)-N(3))-methyltransferase [Oceanomicrobium pacificus]
MSDYHTATRARIRLFVDAPLSGGQQVMLTRDQAHYLFGVMRQGVGAPVLLFNGRDGEWRAKVAEAGKRAGRLDVVEQTAAQALPPDFWLVFAPIKKARTDFIVEKACELGMRRIQPVFTAYTNSERLRRDRLQAHVVEAAEQCGGTFVPDVAEPVKFERLLADWPEGRQIVFCDESRDARPMAEAVAGLTGPAAVLIGPEGGFSAQEAARLRARDDVIPVTLGPRILRADTAAAAALAILQSVAGDWR